MKKLFVAVIAAAFLLTACGNKDEGLIDGHKYATYGIFNKDENKNPNIQYEMSAVAIILSIIFCETIVVPVYFLGFDLYEPVGKKNPDLGPGVIK